MTSGIAQALPLLDAWATYSALQQHIPSVALTVVHGDQPGTRPESSGSTIGFATT